jgi:hypothetical protein
MIKHETYCRYCKLKKSLDDELRMMEEFHTSQSVQKLVGRDVCSIRDELLKMEPCLHSFGKEIKKMFPIV